MDKITGHTLIGLGYSPGKWFKHVLKEANERKLSIPEIIELAEQYKPAPKLELHPNPIEYKQNIVATTSDEVVNLDAVRRDMDIVMKTPTVVDGVIMPDACPTGQKGTIPVGGVIVTKNSIHPSMHSSDMCCSVYATNFGKSDPKRVLDAAQSITHFGPGGRKEHKKFSAKIYDDKYFHEALLSNYFTKDYVEKAYSHLGTQGDGNHFLFVGISEKTGDTYMVTHHGSRGFGASVYKKGLHTAKKLTHQISPDTPEYNAWIPYNDPEGQLYWEAILIVRQWTKLNHMSIHEKVLHAVRSPNHGSFWNEHNSVFKRDRLLYHAKGATPLAEDFLPDSYKGLRLIPLSMNQPILVVKGEATDTNLGFAPHGAGRNVSRKAHRERNASISDEEMFRRETKGLDVRFYSGNIDITELPSAYKNAESVQNQIQQFGLGEVLDRIQPYGCIMAGNWKRK